MKLPISKENAFITLSGIPLVYLLYLRGNFYEMWMLVLNIFFINFTQNRTSILLLFVLASEALYVENINTFKVIKTMLLLSTINLSFVFKVFVKKCFFVCLFNVVLLFSFTRFSEMEYLYGIVVFHYFNYMARKHSEIYTFSKIELNICSKLFMLAFIEFIRFLDGSKSHHPPLRIVLIGSTTTIIFSVSIVYFFVIKPEKSAAEKKLGKGPRNRFVVLVLEWMKKYKHTMYWVGLAGNVLLILFLLLKGNVFFPPLGLMLRKWKIVVYWLSCIVLFLVAYNVILFNSTVNTSFIPRILKRKYFHLLLLILLIPIDHVENREFVFISYGVILALFVLIESARIVYKFDFFNDVVDRKRDKFLILTHIYLLLGCCLPLWLSFNINLRINATVGVFVLGIGDSLGSIIGTFWGRTRLDNGKSVEGMLAGVLGTFVALVVKEYFDVGLKKETLVFYALISTCSCAYETITNEIDNLVVPLYSIAMVNVFCKM